MCGLITLVSDNHVKNYLKEILPFVYYGSIVKNRPKNRHVYFVNGRGSIFGIKGSGNILAIVFKLT